MHSPSDVETLSAASSQLRAALDAATTIGAAKDVYKRASKLADEAGAARHWGLMDQLTTLKIDASKRAGEMLLAGAAPVAGISEETCRRRASLTPEQFARLSARACMMARRRHGELAPEGAERRCEESPATKTLVSAFSTDEFGNRVRFVIGVSPHRYDREVAAGRDPREVAAGLIREAISE